MPDAAQVPFTHFAWGQSGIGNLRTLKTVPNPNTRLAQIANAWPDCANRGTGSVLLASSEFHSRVGLESPIDLSRMLSSGG